MPKQFDGVPKGAPFYNSGAGPLDEKSWVEHIEDLKALDESKFKDKQKIYCFEDQSDYQLNKSATPTTELGKWEKKETANVGVSVKRLGAYTYEATFDVIPEYKESNNSIAGGCTSFIRDNKMYRSFDLMYNNVAEFKVITKNFEGMALIQGLDDGALDFEKIGQLPYHLADGANRHGIMVSEHVLYNDFDFDGVGEKENDLTKLPYVILTNLKSMANITTNTEINNFLANCKIPDNIQALDYLLQFMVSDGTTTYAITPKADGTGYEFIDISSLPKLANFKWINKTTLQRNDADLQDRPNGIERWNLIGDETELKDLRFTISYENSTRLSEFIGDNDTTKDSTDEELTALYNEAHTKYLSRTREDDNPTWQSVHAVVYGVNGIEHLFTQENYDKDYISDTKIKGAIIQAGSTTQTVVIPKNKNYVSSYCVDENNDIVIVPTKVIGATATSEGSVVFTLTNAVDHNIKCIVVCV